jgi:hypothetical protein
MVCMGTKALSPMPKLLASMSFVADHSHPKAFLVIQSPVFISALHLQKLMSTCYLVSIFKMLINVVDETTAARFVAELYNAGGLTSNTGFLVADSAVSNSIGNTLKTNHQLSPDLLKGMIGTTPSLGNLAPMTDCIRKRSPFKGQLTYPAFEAFWENRFKCKISVGEVCTSSVTARNNSCKCPETDTLADYTPNNKIALVNDAVFTLAHALHMIIKNCSAVSTSLCNSTEFTLSDVVTAIQKVQLVGDTGDISFDGPNRKQIFFDIQQFGSTWSTVGYYNTSGFSLDFTGLSWANSQPISSKYLIRIHRNRNKSIFR